MQREDPVETGDPKDLEQFFLVTDQNEVAADTLEPLHPTDENPEPGRVQKFDVGEVDDDRLRTAVDEGDDLLAERRRRIDINFSADLEHGVVADAAGG